MDIALILDSQLITVDMAIDGPGLAVDDGLRTALLVSLFTDARSRDDDELPAGETRRRGWWGDLLAVPGDGIGSRLWLLAREKQTEETRERAQDYAREACQWLIDDGVASQVDVSAEWLDGVGRLGLAVTVHRPGLDAVTHRFDDLWKSI